MAEEDDFIPMFWNVLESFSPSGLFTLLSQVPRTDDLFFLEPVIERRIELAEKDSHSLNPSLRFFGKDF